MLKAIVTGANSEIGVNICKFLLGRNYEVIACYHNGRRNLDKIKSEYMTTKKCDLTNEDEIKSLCELTMKVDLLVNVAAVCFDCNFLEKSKAEFMKTYEVNVVSTFLLAKNLNTKNGYIINISSADGIDTYNDISMDYCASKAALNNLTKTLAMALPQTRVFAIAPGWVDTQKNKEINQEYLHAEMKRTNQKKMVQIEDIIKKISDILDNKYTSGNIIRIDGENENVY